MAFTMEVTCRVCEQRFEPTSESIRRGTWRTCPACQVKAEAHRRAPEAA